MPLNHDPRTQPFAYRDIVSEWEQENGLDPYIPDEIVDSIDWDDPMSFFRQTGMPLPPSTPKPAEVRKEARERATNILRDWSLLHRIIERFEATIQKRWLKRTREQRKKLLLSAWPNMPASHRPDWEAFTKGPPGNPLFKDAFTWPNINQEDLLKPKILLIFLNARGRHPPHAFIGADRDATHVGRTTGNIRTPFLNEHVMMFTGRTTPETYGQLLHWNDDDRAFDWMVTRYGMHPGEGLLALEIQERLYRFLVECCLLLLCDYTRESILQDDIPVQPEPPAVSTLEPGMNTLTLITAEAPYRLPASLDLGRLRSIVAAKRSAAEDHIWALREDPGYFADVILDRREHRPELVPDSQGRQHFALKPYAAKAFWNKIINTVLSDAYFAFGLWDEIQLQLGNLQTLMAKNGPNLRPEKDLPEDLEFAFCKLLWFLEHMVRGPIINLQVGVPPSPPLRSFFVRAEPHHGKDNIRTMSKESFVADKKRNRLSFLLVTLWDERNRHLAGLHNLMDELDRLIESEKSIKSLLSPWVLSTISDLSLMSECEHQISLFQPWAATFENKIGVKEQEIKDDYMKNVDRWTEFDKEMEEVSLGDVGDPSDGRFNYPVDKRRTRETTVIMQRAEANLDAFWKKADSLLINKDGISQHAAIRHLLAKDRILRRTPDWVEPVKDTVPAPNADELCLPLSQLYFDLEQRTQSTVGPETGIPTAKTKLKTRGVTQTVLETAAHPENVGPHGPDVQPTFDVDQRALKVFTTLFYTPSRTSQPGEVAWTDFLHAMRSTGFALEKLYGSVWQFTPQTLDVERSIQFHEPHPSGKIPFRTARRHGRRLSRAYGWHAGMFRLSD
ncbi:hypothetical protein BDV29DRAFT_172510 [Aspergillus leporis]|jgi:hypothetical protein|uniref:Uncharacterized protein n=1 Tax=Aspergillus leporis TaxID=41062 RepID=A0A5N5X2U5_9EURO|nr:hypothetical protein BDV29DRAFT_172510 [Aspergillus leporis]